MSLFLKLICSLEDPTLDTSDIFMVHVSRKSSLNEGLECGCLSHATIAEFLEILWVVLMYA